MSDTENKWQKLDWLKQNGPMSPRADLPRDELPTSLYTVQYKPRATLMFLAIVFCGGGAVWMADTAQHNDRGVIIEGLIRLGPAGATAFYWILSAACAVFVLVTIFYLLPQMAISRRITLEEDAITLPGKGFSREHYRIAANEIERISVTTHQRRTFIKLRALGRSFSINSTWLPSNSEIDIILEWLKQHSPGR